MANEFSDDVSVLPGVGDGTFAATMLFAAGSRPTSLAVVDLDGNGTPDLAMGMLTTGTVDVLLRQCAAACPG